MDIDKEPCVICSVDKDMHMIPGQHFNPVTGEHRVISPHQGMQNFYFQMIMGDTSDNIFGYDGKKRSKVPKFLEPTISMLMEIQTEREMYNYVWELYHDHNNEDYGEATDERMLINGQCLWIWRKQGDMWHVPSANETQLLNQD